MKKDGNRHEQRVAIFREQQYEFDLGFVSPFSRTIQTAEIVQEYIPITFIEEPLLHERSYGIFEGKICGRTSPNYPRYLSRI